MRTPETAALKLICLAAVLLPLLLKVFSLDYTGAAAIMSFKSLLQNSY